MERKRLNKRMAVLFIMCAVVIGFSVSIADMAFAQTPKYGGTVKIIMKRTPLKFGYPPATAGGEWHYAVPVIESLCRRDTDGKSIPSLATSWKVAPDRKSITFILRKGVKFHDGTDFNAKAVKYNLDISKAAKKPGLAKITSVDVLDSSTVRLNLSKYDSTILENLAMSDGMVASPTAIEKNGKQWAFTHPVGTGPFQFESFKRNVHLRYKKYDGYWKKGRPYLDGIEFLFFKDTMTAVASFKAGEAQVINRLQPRAAHELKKKGYEIIPAKIGFRAFAPDSKNPNSIFADIRIRKAVEWAIDRKKAADTFGYGYWNVLTQPSPPQFYGYNPDIKERIYNPEMAKKLLAEAGYPNGFKTRIILNTNYANMDVMVAFKADLAKVGIDVTLDQADRGRISQYQFKGWKNALLYYLNSCDQNYANSAYRYFTSKKPKYVSMKTPPDLDAHLVKTLEEDDQEKRKAMTRKSVKIAHDYAMLIPFINSSAITAVIPEFHSDYNKYHHMSWRPEEAWFSK